ncbi:MAG: NAD-glutamate dehydrogenase [Pseudolabrys sp.]
MNAIHVDRPDEDLRAAQTLIERAGVALAARNEAVPLDFLVRLFARSAAEDLTRYDADELVQLAEYAWAFFAERTPGAPKLRIVPATLPPSPQHKPVTLIEIVNDDMPFLVDSVLSELQKHGLRVQLVAHPVLMAERDSAGRLTKYGEGPRESFIHIHVDALTDETRAAKIVAGIEMSLGQVRLAVVDWKPMLARVDALVAELKANPPPLPVDDIAEAVQFLEWLRADNFTFLGIREYALSPAADGLNPDLANALGVMRAPDMRVLSRGGELLEFTPQIMAFLREPRLLIVTKANVRSLVHRHVHLDYIGVKRFDTSGKLIGEFRIVGLFTSTAYTRSVRNIPYLRRKFKAIERRAGFSEDSHSGKALANIVEHYPRDELFQIDEDTLYRFSMAILQLEERPRVRVLARGDGFDRFVSVLVFVPRERYDSRVRGAIGDYLAQAFIGHVSAYYPSFPEGRLARVHFIIGRDGGTTPEIDRKTLEDAVEKIVRTWSDNFADALALVYEPGKARDLYERFAPAFSPGYRDVYQPAAAVHDIRLIESVSKDRPLGVEFYRRQEEEHRTAGLKVWSLERPLPLSERVPVLENMGFRVVDERTFFVDDKTDDKAGLWLHDMLLERRDGGPIELEGQKQRLESAFVMIMRGVAENDGYNALVLIGGLMWRDVALIRAVSRFLRQARVPFSQDYMWATLTRHAGIAGDIVALFHTRFDPAIGTGRESVERSIVARIETALGMVESLDEDRILRHFVNALTSALRTNFFQLGTDGQPKPQIALKFESGKLTNLPAPRPLYEIFVYSPRVEGIHLRFGRVARGGIRWSDRPQDFRTEILGLVKAQQVKNAVIVPVGAKGGFVPKLLPKAPREAVMAEGIASYKLFISTLLDITDNIASDGAILPPPNVVRHEGDDPYLVVAADKGTATFSDTANAISIAHDFWLNDAFASGGSAGYDHKAMGITARGAWESVKRHFREMDVNIGETPFTVAGVGDMSGDVFGNGMLRETTIRLVAAFDHRDIFIDPDPDPEKSFAERSRLFSLPRSSWQDYDKALLSKGGGIYSRQAKEITLSEEAQAMLGIGARVTPQELMRAVLAMKVDLLWFGGIGTYIRASSETDEAAGDRANDSIRITGNDLNCKVIGEGANLGMTQRGRVEAAQRGIRLNTDAIDNSAGVNTSDVEVNIKIALSGPVRAGELTLEARNTLLAEMTDEVARLVLRNNYQQSLALSLAQRRGLEDLGFQQRLMQILETRGQLDRTVEYLPDELAIAERRKRNAGLTRPELAVLLAYAKLTLYNELLDSNVPDDPYLGRELNRYFPKEMTERFPDALQAHRLRREIIATQLTNSMINRGGATLIVRIADQTGSAPPEIAAAFAAVRNSFGLIELNGEIDGLDNMVPGETQLSLYAAVQDLLLDRLVWFLRNVDLSAGLEKVIAHYRDGIAQVENALDAALSKQAASAREARIAELVATGVPETLAQRIGSLTELKAAPDIILVADRTGKPVAEVTATYFATEAFFQLDRVASAVPGIAVADYFDRLALDRALDSIGDAERRLTAAMVGNGHAGAGAVEAWVEPRKAEVERIRSAIHEIAGSGLTLSKLTVAASLLGDLARH